MSVDRIALTGLRVTGHHGVLPQELRDGQEFIIDAVLGVATAAAAAADDLSLTADYGQLADELAAIGSGEPVALIEPLAGPGWPSRRSTRLSRLAALPRATTSTRWSSPSARCRPVRSWRTHTRLRQPWAGPGRSGGARARSTSISSSPAARSAVSRN